MTEYPSASQQRKAHLERFIIDVIYGRQVEGWARVLAGFLRVCSWLFGGIVRVRGWLYRQGILRPAHLGCLVIVVGNLTVGGTGKTPVVEKLARSLRDRGRKVAILSRGYKSKKESAFQRWWRLLTHAEPTPPREVSNGREVLLGADVAGDEPYMLARNLPGVVVLTDKDRVKAGHYAIKQFGCDTLILDDGFQYYKLKDHLQVLLVDKTNPFGIGALLPRGILREPIHHLKRASYVFFTKSDGNRDPKLEALVRRYKPDLDLIECAHTPQYLQQIGGDERRPLSDLAGRRVHAMSAIAAPESFEGFLKNLGADVVQRRRYLDHHRFERWELDEVAAAAAADGVDYLVTTEKDSVRLPADWKPSVPVFYLRVEIEILAGIDDFEAVVSRICFPRQSFRFSNQPFPPA